MPQISKVIHHKTGGRDDTKRYDKGLLPALEYSILWRLYPVVQHVVTSSHSIRCTCGPKYVQEKRGKQGYKTDIFCNYCILSLCGSVGKS